MSPLDSILEGLRKACSELEKAFGFEFEGLVLFGSWARGEAREDSDVDVLVVFKSLQGLKARAKAYHLIWEHVKKPLTLVTATTSDLTRGALTPLGLNIGFDGIVVCDRSGVLTKFKSEVLDFVEKYGLVRYRTSNGKYGWGRKDGKPLVEVIK